MTEAKEGIFPLAIVGVRRMCENVRKFGKKLHRPVMAADEWLRYYWLLLRPMVREKREGEVKENVRMKEVEQGKGKCRVEGREFHLFKSSAALTFPK